MKQEEQRKFYERKLEVIEQDYNRVRATTNALRCDISDLSFDERVQDPQERYLMVEKLKTLEAVQTNMLNLIRFYRHKVKANKPEPWEENEAVRKIETPCGPVRVVDTDNVSKEELGEMIHHCGLDSVSNEEELQSLEDLLGMEVVAICGSKTKCEGCARGNTDCVRLELVGGDYICLAKPEQDKPNVISFDEEDGECLDNIIGDIKEDVDKFMDCIDGMFKKKTTSHDKEL